MNELVPIFNGPAWIHLTLYVGIAGAVLLLSLLVWLRRRRTKKNSPAQQPIGLTSEGMLKPSPADRSDPGSTHLDVDPGDGQKSSLPTFKKRSFRDERTITKHIQIAELASDQKALASLYLERACLDISKGNMAAAGDQLRKSIMLATSHDLKDVHAAARLELAELAEADGDMTTACEHWQMARSLFHELDAQDDLKKTDTRMLSNGCPTDWVLTDF